MGCVEKESCPTLFIHNVIDWNLHITIDYDCGECGHSIQTHNKSIGCAQLIDDETACTCKVGMQNIQKTTILQ
jgi:hypothetical protein